MNTVAADLAVKGSKSRGNQLGGMGGMGGLDDYFASDAMGSGRELRSSRGYN